MHKAATDGTRAAIQIFIRAPASEITTPIMKLKGNVANSVSQIESYDTPLFVSDLSDKRDIKELPSVVLDSTDEDESCAAAVLTDHLQHKIHISRERTKMQTIVYC